MRCCAGHSRDNCELTSDSRHSGWTAIWSGWNLCATHHASHGQRPVNASQAFTPSSSEEEGFSEKLQRQCTDVAPIVVHL